jgi:hypothetical protein
MSLNERLATIFSLPFTYDRILGIYRDARSSLIVDDEVAILDPQKFCDMVVGFGKVVFVGKVDAFFSCTLGEFEILCFHKEGASFNHFCSGDGHGLVAYDPWSVDGSDSVKNGSVIGKRLYRLGGS